MKAINVGLIGFGNVGSGVISILRDRKTLLSEKTGSEIMIKKVFDKDITSKRKISVDKKILTSDVSEILNDPQIDIVVELIGGIHPAKEFIEEALRKGKSVVTANKALLAECGKELFALAKDRNKSIYFEASVGAGIPLIKALREGLVANRFNSVYGIVNGTSNFILTQMSTQNRNFDDCLKDAQKKGFAESNPTLDIEGFDSAHKLAVLTYLAFGIIVESKDILIEGISHISLSDVAYAKELGYEIKLLAIAKKENDELEVRVHPTLLPKTHMLSSVTGVFNAIYVSCDLAGDLLFYGPGAGQLSAASAVVSDLIDLTQSIKAGLFRPTLNVLRDNTIKKLRNSDNFISKYYINFLTADKPGVLAKISGVLAKFGISIASVTQKETYKSQVVSIVMITHQAKEHDLKHALAILSRLDQIKQKPVAIRIEEV